MKTLKKKREFNYMPPSDIELLFEWLEDRGYLSKKGIKFREEFWNINNGRTLCKNCHQKYGKKR